MNDIKPVLIAGYGLMGRGIALTFARGGHPTVVLSRDPSKAADIPEGVSVVGELPAAAPDLIIESIPEDMGLKLAFFEKIEKAYGDGPVIASNTSGLSLQELADPRRDPANFLGIHYFQPAEAFPMVEVIRCAKTGGAAFERVRAALKRNGQDTIEVNRPLNGFVINRLQHALLHEAFYLVQEGICTARDVDNFCQFMFGPRMCATGLLEQKDISGLNTTAAAQSGIVPTLFHNNEVSPMLLDLAARGDLGAKTGKGLYDWAGRDVDALKARAADKLRRILAIVQEP
ncbi:MAG: 3-hydroxyacyl-CoA dehydrogenase NAD-binding domain-containing protein [Alphaproteobacteria bacterium]|nr:3-hydroxyacyl-CoA dehydrogenase NAD-binding domain-containing protein [Alphaproteobacteria bacterium]